MASRRKRFDGGRHLRDVTGEIWVSVERHVHDVRVPSDSEEEVEGKLLGIVPRHEDDHSASEDEEYAMDEYSERDPGGRRGGHCRRMDRLARVDDRRSPIARSSRRPAGGDRGRARLVHGRFGQHALTGGAPLRHHPTPTWPIPQR